MEVTLTHLDSTRGVHEILPNTDPMTGVTVFTARPCKAGDRPYGLVQDLLGGYGVRSDVMGAGRNVDESLLYIRARMRTYATRLLVVRLAENLIPQDAPALLDLLADLCQAEGVDLALTCDDVAGEKLAGWVESRSGVVEKNEKQLLSLMPPRPEERSATSATAWFPRSVPKGDFYIFRARAREVLTAEAFETVDSCYVRVARNVYEAPFTSIDEAAVRLRALVATTDNPAEAITMLRAAQAAMFRRGLLLKVDVPFFVRSVRDAHHRQLNENEFCALRAFRTTWRSAAVVLSDAGFSIAEVVAMTIAESRNITLSPEGQRLVECHRHFRALNGASDDDRLIEVDVRRLDAVRREAATDLHIPGCLANQSRSESIADRWRRDLGITLKPLADPHLPPAEELTARWNIKEAA